MGNPSAGNLRSEVRLIQLPDTGLVRVRFLDDYQGTYTHFLKGPPKQSIGCTGDGKCPPAHHRLPLIWKGFAPVEQLILGPPHIWRPAILEVTDRLAVHLGEEPLRGTVWNIGKRLYIGTQKEVFGELVEHIDPRPLRTDVDAKRVAQRVLKTLNLQWGVSPLLDAPQLLDAMLADNQPQAPPPSKEPEVLREYYEGDFMPARFREELRAAGRLLPGNRPKGVTR